MGLSDLLRPVRGHYRKRQIICSEGDEISQLMMILEGNAKMYVNGINGSNIIISILPAQSYIGLIAVLGYRKFKYSAAALSDCHICHIGLETVRKMYRENNSFMDGINNQITDSISHIMSKLVSLNQKQVRGKVAESLLYLSGLSGSERFTLPVTRRELGELSAISEENTVRILTEFRTKGIIEINGREILISDNKMLKSISQQMSPGV
jgi:CRP/FNR family transcriptional regulator, polysaccharide utilization system transcription regulator